MNRDYKSLFGGSAAALGGVVVIGGCNYLTRRILVGSLSLDHYGFFYGMFSFVVFAVFVARLGTTEATAYLLPRAMAENKECEARSLFSWIGRFTLAATFCLVLAGALFSPWIARHLLDYPPGTFYWCLFLPYAVITGIDMFTIGCLNGMREFLVNNLIQSGKAMLLFLAVWLTAGSWGILSPILFYNLLFLISALSGLLHLRRRRGWSLAVPPGPGMAGRVFPVSVWLAMFAFGDTVVTHLSTVCLAVFSSLEEVALYNIAMPVAQIVKSLVALSVVFAPVATEMFVRGQYRDVRRLCLLVTGLELLAFPFLALVLWLFGDQIITLMFGSRFIPARNAMAVITSAMIFWAIAQFNMTALNAMGKQHWSAWITLAGALAAISGFCLFLPRGGALAAAVVSGGACVLWAAVSGVVLFRHLAGKIRQV